MIPVIEISDQITVNPETAYSSPFDDLFRDDEGLEERVDDLRAVAFPPFLPLSDMSSFFVSFFARGIFSSFTLSGYVY